MDTRDYKKLYSRMTLACIVMIFNGPDMMHPYFSGFALGLSMFLMFTCSDIWTGYTE